jgi:hypothetical protein
MNVTTKRLNSHLNALADALALEDADADRWAASISTVLPAEETRNPPDLVDQVDYAGMWPNESYSEPDEDIAPALLTEESQAIYLETMEALGKRIARASLEELRPEIDRALRWCQHHHDAKIDGGFERLAWAVVHKRLRAHRNKYGHRHLLRERRDQELREAAMGRHDSALITYLAHARRVFDNARLAYGNPAGVRQIVFSKAPSLVFEGNIAGGGAAQTLVVDRGAFTFGLGVTF